MLEWDIRLRHIHPLERSGGSETTMEFDPGCKYSEEHEWVRVEGEEGVLGITDYAQSQLSDVVYVELPEVGDSFDRGEIFATVESVKAASDIFMPVGGEILAINAALEDTPGLVNQDPFGEAWLVRIRIADPEELSDLMDAEAYRAFVEGLE
jgi:glycine cleavage system H protein